MAITISDTPKMGNISRSFENVPCSVQSDGYVTIHSNVLRAADGGYNAESAGVLLRPLSATTAGIIAKRIINPIGRAIFRLKYPQAVTVSANPVIRIFGIFGEPTSGAFLDDGTVQFKRLDAQAWTTAGLTLTVGSNSADARDTTYCYSAPSSLVGMDLQCAKYLLALVETAAVLSAGAGPIELQALFQN